MNQNHLRHWKIVAVCASLAFTQIWFWSRLFSSELILAHSDMYEQFLPAFLAPAALWSSAEFGGLPLMADPQTTMWYPLHLLFAGAVEWWSAYVVSAYVLAAVGAAAYAWHISRSHAAALIAGLAWPWSEALADLFPHLAMLHGFAWLPWILFGLEKVAETRRGVWVGATALWFGCLALSGHPQVSVYCAYLAGAYGVALWLAGTRDRASASALVGVFALGALLAAVQIVPTLEASTWIARDQVGFAQFSESFAKKPHELMTVLIPQFCHERREAPSYTGVATIWLAIVAVAAAGGQWRVRFWAVVAVIGLLLGLGSLTPLARVVYELPLYDKFRVVARHLALYSFAVIALGALGIAAIRDGRLSPRRASVIAASVTAAAFAGLAYVAASPALFDFKCNGHGLGLFFPALVTDVRLQGAFVVVAGAIVMLSSRPKWRIVALAAVPAVLAIDLLNAQSEPVDLEGLQPPTMIDRSLLGPSVHAARLRDELRPQHQRLLPLEGSATDPVVPGAFARLWQIPSLGGYNPLLPERFRRLALMDANGAVRSRLLLEDDVTLDMFAVKYVIVRASELVPAGSVALDTAPEALAQLDVLMGPSDCGPRGRMRLALGTPAALEARAIIVVGRLRCGDNVKDGTPVGTVTVGSGSQIHTVRMQAGIEPAGLGVLVVQNRGRDADISGVTAYRASLPAPIVVNRVQIETEPILTSMQVDAIALETTDGRLVPLSLPTAAVEGGTRWREHTRFSTSRDSDRGADGGGRDEVDYVVLENTRAQPRAWFVGDVLNISEDDAVDTVRFGRTREGTPLDVGRTAFVTGGGGARGGGGTGRVIIDAIGDSRFELTVESTSPGLAVVSELHHPGWRARVDGWRAPLLRVNHAIMGVAVPAGTHHLVLEFDPESLKVGAALSLIACGIVAGCFASPLRRRGRSARG